MKDILVSCSFEEVLERAMRADGKQTHAPAGNSNTNLRSQRTMWPLFDASNSPKAVIVHHPTGQF